MKKPVYEHYHRSYLDTNSITEAERMMDDDKQRYSLAMTEWVNSLSKSERRKVMKDRTVWPYVYDVLLKK